MRLLNPFGRVQQGMRRRAAGGRDRGRGDARAGRWRSRRRSLVRRRARGRRAPALRGRRVHGRARRRSGRGPRPTWSTSAVGHVIWRRAIERRRATCPSSVTALGDLADHLNSPPTLSAMKSVAVLGATGSIGTQALESWARTPSSTRVRSAAHSDHAERWSPPPARTGSAGSRSPTRPPRPAARREFDGEVLAGPEGVERLVARVRRRHGAERDRRRRRACGATLAAFAAGADLALANKESLVAGGELVLDARDRARRAAAARSTASTPRSPSAWQGAARRLGRRAGGHRLGRAVPGLPPEPLGDVTPRAGARASRPGAMGAKITDRLGHADEQGPRGDRGPPPVRRRLRRDRGGRPPAVDRARLVRFRDGALLAHLGLPDMRVPISWALTYPERAATPAPRLDLAPAVYARVRAARTWRRSAASRWPATRACEGGTAPCVLNAANEVAVAAFLAGAVGFPDIAGRGRAGAGARHVRAARARSSRCSRPTRARARRRPDAGGGGRMSFADRDRRPAGADLHPRAGPLRRRQGGRHARAAVLPSASRRRSSASALARHRVRIGAIPLGGYVKIPGMLRPEAEDLCASRTCWSGADESTRPRRLELSDAVDELQRCLDRGRHDDAPRALAARARPRSSRATTR